MSYDRLNTTPEAVAEAIIKVAETDLELAIELLKEVKKTESPEIMNAAITKVVSATMQLAANTPKPKDVAKIIEGLAKCYLGYQHAKYEYNEGNQYHYLIVEFSCRPYIMVQVADDLCSAIVMLNARMIKEFSTPDADLSNPVLTALEQDFTGFTEPSPTTHRTEYATPA